MKNSKERSPRAKMLLQTKAKIIYTHVFQITMYGYESYIVKKTDRKKN